ncbi:MAG: hypothetical protein HY842_13805 [Bacteroidetes bacterium]|nr:hypothetical protein [Bacteroidota bacterium]
MRNILLVFSLYLGGLPPIIAQIKAFRITSIDVQCGFAGSYMVEQLVLSPDTTHGKFLPPNSNVINSVGRFEISAISELSSKHFLDFGFMLKKYRYKIRPCGVAKCADYDIGIALTYLSLKFAHQYEIAKGIKVSAAVVNGFQLDLALSDSSPNALRKLSLGYIGKFNFYYRLSKLNALVFSPEYTIAITRYNKKEVRTAFRPYSCGIMLGLSHRI